MTGVAICKTCGFTTTVDAVGEALMEEHHADHAACEREREAKAEAARQREREHQEAREREAIEAATREAAEREAALPKCGDTADVAVCACGCSGYEDRCAVYLLHYDNGTQVPPTHVCCRIPGR